MAHELQTLGEQDEAYGKENETDAAISRVERPCGDFQSPPHTLRCGHLFDATAGKKRCGDFATPSVSRFREARRCLFPSPSGENQPRKSRRLFSVTRSPTYATRTIASAPSPVRHCLKTWQRPLNEIRPPRIPTEETATAVDRAHAGWPLPSNRSFVPLGQYRRWRSGGRTAPNPCQRRAASPWRAQ